MALIEAIRSGAIDRVLVWSVDRIGKSLADLVGFMETCRSACVAVNLHDEGFDSETSNGLSLFDVSALLAHHLRQSRRDRILRGQAAARALSIRFGRPPIATAEGREGQASPGVRQGRATGCQDSRNFPGVGFKNQDLDERRGHRNLTLEQQNTSGYE